MKKYFTFARWGRKLSQRLSHSLSQRLPQRFMLALALALLALLLSACGNYPYSTFDVVGDVARDQRDLFMLTFWLGLIVFVVVSCALVYALWRFGISKKAQEERESGEIPTQIHGNATIEIIWTVLPILLLIIIGIPTVKQIWEQEDVALHHVDDDIVVNVTGYQWWWEFEYPEYGFTTANELVIPVGKRVTLNLQSGDVLHSFWAPRLAGKKDLIPNQDNVLFFTPQEEGNYYGQCAELCLGAHAYMRFRVLVESEADFEAWTEKFTNEQVLQQVSLDPQVQRGKLLFKTKGCAGCHAVGNENYAQGMDAPDLTNFGLRTTVGAARLPNTDENLAAWLRDPQALKPTNYMPTLWPIGEGVSDEVAQQREEEIAAIVAYLQSLGNDDVHEAQAGL